MKNLFFLFFLLPMTAMAQTPNDVLVKEAFNGRTEVYFSFKADSKSQVNSLSKVISIDHRSNSNEVRAYANKKQFADFLALEIPYTILKSAGEKKTKPKMKGLCKKKSANSWDYYPTYAGYDSIMYSFQANYPSLCTVHNIGSLSSGRKLLIAHIGDSLSAPENEPRFLYTSSMHGDELTGYVLMLRLIDYLLSNYGTDPRITDMVNGIDIWINPLANPDGAYVTNDNTISGATRYNANSVDLNRNYPDPEDGSHPDGNAYQEETEAFMALVDTLPFDMSCNLHTGAEVVNYPWDTWAKLHADDDWWVYVSRQYADTVQAYSGSNYFTDLGNGITNGNDWYEIDGGRQDYMTYYKRGREFTLELSGNKIPNANNLPSFWEYNYRSLLNYMEQSMYGLRGIVTDSITGQPLNSLVEITGHDQDSSHVYTHLPIGNYHRYLDASTYSVTYSSTGYHSKTISSTVQENVSTFQDVQLVPLGTVDVSYLTNPRMQILPNPSTSQTIVTLGGLRMNGLKVFDMTGRQCIVSYSLIEMGAVFQASELSKGVYTIEIYSENQICHGKLLVE